jgi:hypothetical protein
MTINRFLDKEERQEELTIANDDADDDGRHITDHLLRLLLPSFGLFYCLTSVSFLC